MKRILIGGLVLQVWVAQVWASDLDSWIAVEKQVALSKMMQNISPPGTQPGVVIAAPAREYYFHWVRDASITMDVVQHVLPPQSSYGMLKSFAQFSRWNQVIPTPSGARNVGEPKFNVNGSAYTGDWGRPQDDGPASRSLVLAEYANRLLDQGASNEAKQLYDGKIPTESVIKADLEYLSHHWQETSFDLWEEIKGIHFYTRMMQRKALFYGAKLARRMGDPGAAAWYEAQASQITVQLTRHWDSQRGYIVSTLDRDGGIDYKTSNLDSAVLLGALYGETPDGVFSIRDPRVQTTVERLAATFKTIYFINRNGVPGVAIGRYPEDRYYGGNPWVLLTLSMAEYYYRLGNKAQGDAFMERIKYHANPDGSLSEQMDRNTGFMKSMPNLTWNYGAFLRAVSFR